ncbi:PEGA domain-containing protein [Butyrivibrio sp. INlla16]|uniref:PEGA domain-containing protein n=1 Tax=Butyrivibrio sp. INlla16 TaxID=1520807 RepID=UPI000887FAC1|nr:PEGA domain-containing protein [Butyrivibrio sp. INlla16]SDB65406.1 PEGA domain-containing protein [Butyrivibrio sp. INlla16]
MKKKMRNFFILLFALAFASMQPMYAYAEETDVMDDGKVRVSLLGKYDSADTASVKQINTLSHTIQFRNHDVGKNYTLSYDNTSMIYDIHGKPMSASMLEVGQVVDITFLKGVKHLNSLVVSTEAWVENDVNDFDLVRGDETAKINGTVFHITPRTLIISDGQAVNAEDILATDTLRVSGLDKEIYSIVVTRGHGYVSLSSDTVDDRSLVGAWIELDKEVIRKITPRMLISAPEGNYNVSISGNGAKFSSEIVVNRNEETVIDTSVAEVEKIKEGNVTFIVTPSDARVFVDGQEVLKEVPHSYTYGKHKLHVMAEGYEPQDHILKVAERDATLFIDLTPKDGTNSSEEGEVTDGDAEASDAANTIDTTGMWTSSDNSSSTVSSGNAANTASSKTTKNNSKSKASSDASSSKTAGVDPDAAATKAPEADTSSSSSSGSSGGKSSDASSTGDNSDSSDTGEDEEDENTISGYKVTFDAPIGAEAYLDGNYVGIMPVSFTKIAGQHMVTLQKEGYETKSYTIQIDKEKTNVTYTFPALTPVSKPDEPDNGGSDDSGEEDSGNSDSGSEGTGDDAKPEEVSGGQP